MIDAPPTNPLPVPPTKPVYFALLLGPASLLTMRPGTILRASKLFNAEVGLITLKELLKGCAGAIYIGDESAGVPRDDAATLDYFFSRDAGEALVFRYRPFENDFVLITPEWLEARRKL